jgi:flavin-binding protein dodecin
VVLLGYGAYTAWNAWIADDPAPTSVTATADYEGAVSQAMYFGGIAVGAGLDVHLMADLGTFVDTANRAIAIVEDQHTTLERLGRRETGARADLVASSLQSVDALSAAIAQWRDAVYNLRLARAAEARSAIDAATARLQADLDRWRSRSA